MRLLNRMFAGGVALLCGLATGCSTSTSAVATVSPDAYQGQIWQLIAIDGQPLAAGQGSYPSLQFDDNRVSGLAGCNRFFGAFELVDGELQIGPLASTRMACQPPLDQLEQDYLQRLELMRQINMDGMQLRLSGAGHELLFREQD